jgi:eukaryotic-like serine/threonine-protein kinase
MRAQVKDDPSIKAVGSSADDTQPGVRALGGRLCPRCRHREDAAPASSPPRSLAAPGKVPRCPADGYALIDADRLADADGDPFLGRTLADRFVILGRLGAGSMGTVYLGRQEAMGRDVAIKILRSDRALDAQAKQRFTREARAMSQLTSPHTVTVFDFGEVPDPPGDELSEGGSSLYLAMELLEGEALGDRLKRKPRLSVADAVRVTREALLSLEEAHDKGIIHRDLKPDNLFLARSAGAEQHETCKVLDFGIAKVTTEQAGVDALETQAGTVFGTPRYMSPEQAQGRALDPRSDLYSLGVLLYQMLVGRPPFVDEDAVVVMARHIKSVPKAPHVAAPPEAAVGEALSAVVMSALAKEPARRPASAKEFIAALDRAMEDRAAGRPSPAPATAVSATGETAVVREDPEAFLARSERVRRRSAWIVIGTAAAVIAAGLLAIAPFRGDRVPLARAELARSVAQRLAAARAAEAAAAPSEAPAPSDTAIAAPSAAPSASAIAPAPPAATASPAALPLKPASPPKRPRKPYTRFD